jgi:hypothetical protein
MTKTISTKGRAVRLNNGELIHPEYYKKMRAILDEVANQVYQATNGTSKLDEQRRKNE